MTPRGASRKMLASATQRSRHVPSVILFRRTMIDIDWLRPPAFKRVMAAPRRCPIGASIEAKARPALHDFARSTFRQPRPRDLALDPSAADAARLRAPGPYPPLLTSQMIATPTIAETMPTRRIRSLGVWAASYMALRTPSGKAAKRMPSTARARPRAATRSSTGGAGYCAAGAEAGGAAGAAGVGSAAVGATGACRFGVTPFGNEPPVRPCASLK